MIGGDLGGDDAQRSPGHHVRHMILGMWFEHGVMPHTWAEIEASQQAS